MSMNLEKIFSQYQHIWDECYLGYVICENPSGQTSLEVVNTIVREKKEFYFYPWLNEKHGEKIVLPSIGVREISPEEFKQLFLHMAQEAIAYGSEVTLSKEELKSVLAAFLEDVKPRSCFSNFGISTWQPVTKHTQDSFLCAVGVQKLGFWFSCNDE